jgi:hypothetical protein
MPYSGAREFGSRLNCRGANICGAQYCSRKREQELDRELRQQAIIPPLYESTLLIVGSDHFTLRGFERVGEGANAFDVLQEWQCTTVCPVCEAGQRTHAIRTATGGDS